MARRNKTPRKDIIRDNLKSFIDQLFAKYNEDFFVPNYSKYIVADGFQIFYDNAIKSSEIDDVFCLAIYYFKQSEYLKSIDCYKQLIVSGVSTQLLYFNILQTLKR